MTHTLLDVLPLWAILTISFGVILFAAEAGHRLGSFRHRREVREKETTAGSMAAAQLGLLGFLLAFTFGMAATRFEARRQAVLDEANIIGTTLLRAKLLPEPQRTDMQKRLCRSSIDRS